MHSAADTLPISNEVFSPHAGVRIWEWWGKEGNAYHPERLIARGYSEQKSVHQ